MRPTSLTVFGILNIGFGALGLACTPVGLFSMEFVNLFTLGQDLPSSMTFPFQLLETPAYRTYLMVSTLLGMAASGVLIFAGVGLLKMRGWGRLLSIGYSLYAYLSLVAGFLVTVFFVWTPMLENLNRTSPLMRMSLVGSMSGATMGMCSGLIYPTVLLVFMFLPSVKAVFKPVLPPPLPPVVSK